MSQAVVKLHFPTFFAVRAAVVQGFRTVQRGLRIVPGNARSRKTGTRDATAAVQHGSRRVFCNTHGSSDALVQTAALPGAAGARLPADVRRRIPVRCLPGFQRRIPADSVLTTESSVQIQQPAFHIQRYPTTSNLTSDNTIRSNTSTQKFLRVSRQFALVSVCRF